MTKITRMFSNHGYHMRLGILTSLTWLTIFSRSQATNFSNSKNSRVHQYCTFLHALVDRLQHLTAVRGCE